MFRKSAIFFCALFAAHLLLAGAPAYAQQTPVPNQNGNQNGDGAQPPGASAGQPEAANDDPETMLPHLRDDRFWVSAQANFIFQSHPPFPAEYTGTHSLLPFAETGLSRVVTVYTGARFSRSGEVLFDAEEAGGQALSQGFGMAGNPDLDIVRNPQLSKSPYVARIIVHQVVGLSKDKVENDRNPLSLFSELPARRLEFRVGKYDMVDFFDLNSVGSDSHFQFMNWTLVNNGAYDYAADTRGYTWGAIIEYDDRAWSLRAAEGLMPTVANGIVLQWNLRRAHSENYEFEWRRSLLPKQPGVIRLLHYQNYANMGIYRIANEEFLAGVTPNPEITDHPMQVTRKYGFGANLEQGIASWAKVFGRFGWDNGKTESFAYTEDDLTVAFGAGFLGSRWHRRQDRAGAAFVSNGISRDHRTYLALGGLGFLLGDGGLTYGREQITESYYTAHLWRGIYIGPDVQYAVNPGYNQVRGPVVIASMRGHIEF